MALKATTIRVSPELWEMLEREAARQEISVSQFVRDAALLRVGYLAGARGDAGGLESVGDLAGRSNGERRRFSADDRRRRLEDPLRLAAVEKVPLAKLKEDPVLHRLTRLAARALDAPVALCSIVGADRQFFASSWGLPEPWASRGGTDLVHSFCQHVVISNQPLLVDDARKHPLLHSNLAIQDLDVVAYIGVPLNDAEVNTLGSFCVIDHEPRRWKRSELEMLHDFAAAVTERIESRA